MLPEYLSYVNKKGQREDPCHNVLAPREGSLAGVSLARRSMAPGSIGPTGWSKVVPEAN